MNNLVNEIKRLLRDVVLFSQYASRVKLRGYQEAVARAVTQSVKEGLGLSFVVMFPRQSGKNELQAQIECYLLTVLSRTNAEIVKISPTWKPQTLNAMRRLERVLESNLISRGQWSKERGYIYRIGTSRIFFFSGSPEANIVGATASTLLEVDEAQDIQIDKYDRDIAPMAASTNATRILWGTAWTSRTLLARELRAAREAEKRDGRRRVFTLGAEDVAREVPAYGEFVAEQVAKLGRYNPMVRTQFFSEEIDAEGGLFPAARIEMMKGDLRQPPQMGPVDGRIYAMLVDVAGEDEGMVKGAMVETHPNQNGASVETHPNKDGAGNLASLQHPGRDATALTVVEVGMEREDGLRTYRAVYRKSWVGVKQTRLYDEIRGMATAWRCRKLVVDATGVGAGLASFLERALGGRVVGFVFNAKTKSELGWDFINIVDSGRWREYEIREKQPPPDIPQNGKRSILGEEKDKTSQECFAAPRPSPLTPPPRGEGDRRGEIMRLAEAQGEFYRQLGFCEYEITPGPEKKMKWGVKDGTRDMATGEVVHDDWIISAALAGALEKMELTGAGPALVVQAKDPLEEMDKGF